MSLSLSPTYSYNQKDALVEAITTYIDTYSIESLLDIGAGDGAVAIPISKQVSHYHGIEQRPDWCRKLIDAGLTITEGTFPHASISETYDMVLASHAIPQEDTAAYDPFVEKAWSCLSPGGVLVIITFKGNKDDTLSRAVEEYRGTPLPKDPYAQQLTHTLRHCGTIHETHVVSYIETQEISDLYTVLSDLFSPAGQPIHAELFERIIDRHFKAENGYRIPTQHRILSIEK